MTDGIGQEGLTLIYTGDGKGKTTASVGLAVRAIGRGLKVKMIQFIKSEERESGEVDVLRKLGADVEVMGRGFTWTKTPKEHRDGLTLAWSKAMDTVLGGEYDVVILDELNNALSIDTFLINDILTVEDVLTVIENKPAHLHLVITGRNAPEEIKAAADLVTVMTEEKHYYDRGIPAVYGVEY